ALETTSAVVATIDAYACTACEPPVAAVSGPAGFPRLCVRPGANGVAPEAMFTFVESVGSRTLLVVAHRFRSDDGLEWDRGGGCGGGVAAHGCAVVGNGGYSLRLGGAPPQVPALLVVGARAANIGCGAC